jgi:Mg/Co/Ni transporter MgtE
VSGHWELLESYLSAHPAEAAGLLESMPEAQAAALLDSCPPSAAAAVLPRMDAARAAATLAACDTQRAGALLEVLEAATAQRLLRRLDPEQREKLLTRLPAELGAALRLGLEYPPDTAGGLMDPRALSLPADVTVREARRRIRRNARFALDLVFVTDREQKLRGAVPLRAALLSPAHTLLGDLAEATTPQVSASAGQAAVLAHPGWARYGSIAVVDPEGRLLGVIAEASLSAIRVGAPQTGSAGPVAAGLAIGELYWITAARLFGALVGAPDAQEER